MSEAGALLDALVATLEETGTQPVPPSTSRWLTEAEAVAADARAAAREGTDSATVHERLVQVQTLLNNVDTTGDPKADEHVAEAEHLLTRLLDELDG